MPRILLAVLLSCCLSSTAFAENYRVRCECEYEPTLADLFATDAPFGCEDVRPPAIGRRIKPILCRPQLAKVIPPGNAAAPDASLQAFLKRWTEDARDLQEVRVQALRITYDDVFHTEKRAFGEIGVRPGLQGWIKLDDVEPKVPVRTIGNQQYTRKPDSPEEWYLTEQLIYKVNRETGTYESVPSPKSRTTSENVSGLLGIDILYALQSYLCRWTFLIAPSYDELQTEFIVSSIPRKAGQVLLKLEPRSRKNAANFREIQVLIDANSLRTLAVRFNDPAGTKSTVFMFKNKRVIRTVENVGPIPIPDLTDFQRLTNGWNQEPSKSEPRKPKPRIEPQQSEKTSSEARNLELTVYLHILKFVLLGL